MRGNPVGGVSKLSARRVCPALLLTSALLLLAVAGCSRDSGAPGGAGAGAAGPGAGAAPAADGGGEAASPRGRAGTETGERPSQQDGAAEPGAAAREEAGVRTYAIDPAESEAAYHVDEVFLERNQFNTAVGRTRSIEGELVLDLDKGRVLPSTVKVDLSTLKSDRARRDQAVQRALGVPQFRYATYTVQSASGSPAFTPGEEETFRLNGILDLHGQKRPIVFDVRSRRETDVLTWTAAASFKMTDFGIRPPNVAGLVSVEDEVRVEVRITARPTPEPGPPPTTR